MRGMFLGATSFNGDLSKWDVSSVTDIRGMFLGATLFKRNFCTTAWVHSKASKDAMFEGSSGSISSTVCEVNTIPAIFSPQSGVELKSAVDAYLQQLPKGRGVHSQYGPIGEWDVSRVSDMSRLFDGVTSFEGDISKWDVSRVTDMSRLFFSAASFNSDISKWDVSHVTSMNRMFASAASFNGDISKWDVSRVTDMSRMFLYASLYKGDVST